LDGDWPSTDLTLMLQLFETLVTDEYIITNFSEKLYETALKLLDLTIYDDRSNLLSNFVSILFYSTESARNIPTTWINHITSVLEKIMQQVNGIAKTKVIYNVMKAMKTSKLFDSDNVLRYFTKNILIEKVLDTEMMTVDQQ
jgi:hypothetical protein